MGFFSWKTCDTDESIANQYADHPNSGRKVYLLQPNGLKPICECNYEGYGVFGGIDVFVWLIKTNIPKLYKSINDLGSIRSLGIALIHGFDTFIDGNDIYVPERHIQALNELGYDKKVISFKSSHEDLIKDGTKTIFDAIQDGKVKYKQVKLEYEFPIKLSFNEHAVYEHHNASKNCEFQGFFYPEIDNADL